MELLFFLAPHVLYVVPAVAVVWWGRPGILVGAAFVVLAAEVFSMIAFPVLPGRLPMPNILGPILPVVLVIEGWVASPTLGPVLFWVSAGAFVGTAWFVQRYVRAGTGSVRLSAGLAAAGGLAGALVACELLVSATLRWGMHDQNLEGRVRRMNVVAMLMWKARDWPHTPSFAELSTTDGCWLYSFRRLRYEKVEQGSYLCRTPRP